MGRWRSGWLVLAMTVGGAGCAGTDTVAEQRAEMLSRTCASFAERRLGDDFDREALAVRAGPEAFAEALQGRAGVRPSGVQTMLRLCRPERVDR